jgi:DNA processing protein
MALEPEQKNIASWLVLSTIERFGVKRFLKLMTSVKSIDRCFNDDGSYTDLFVQWSRLHKLTLPYPFVDQIEPALIWSMQANNQIITIQDANYPLLLRQLASPPLMLYIRGDSNILNKPQIAMVGSRRPSIQGGKNAVKFAREIAEQGWIVTSGLALGIDAISHEACLNAGGKTIAVLGNGLGEIYPKRNFNLAQRIFEGGGAIVSEFALDVGPRPQHFPRRNRIVSGLSHGVLVVEAAAKSGSLITASYALEQGREVFALPGLVSNAQSEGCHHLIRQGAKIVDCVTHIFEELPNYASAECMLANSEVSSDRNSQFIELPDLLNFVDDVCTPIDVVIDRSSLSAQDVTMQLMELELEGWVTSVPGGYVRNDAGVMP